MAMIASMRTLSALAVVAALAGCSSSSSGPVAGSSCAIPDGDYTMTTMGIGGGGPDCLGGTSPFSWPVTAPGANGVVIESCSGPTTFGASCSVSCAVPGPSAETFALAYTLTSGGFSGSATDGPIEGEDGGTYTCVYAVTATKN